MQVCAQERGRKSRIISAWSFLLSTTKNFARRGYHPVFLWPSSIDTLLLTKRPKKAHQQMLSPLVKGHARKKISKTVHNAAIFSHDLVELSRGLFQIHNTDKHQSVPLFRAYQYCYILHRPFQACFPISREPVPDDL